jgi:predicted dehydrogenase
MTEARLMTLDPGHFHAALVQKEMYAGVAPRVHVYAPLGPDLIAHLQRLAGFNSRPRDPTRWEVEVHASPDFRQRMLQERPGNVVVLSGRNRGKIEAIAEAMAAGLHVLADKPWIISAADLPRLEAVLDQAQQRGLVAYDIMTERHEITSILQRELVNDPEVFGTVVPGSESEPAVFMESVHYLLKQVAGAPLRRPAWFFDVDQQGEGLTDVGPHLADLVTWLLFPDQPIDPRGDVHVYRGEHWPTPLTRADFQRITGEPDFPDFLVPALSGERLDYYCNNRVGYALRGIHVELKALWGLEDRSGGGDSHFARVRGSRSAIEVRQGAAENHRPEVYVVPVEGQGGAVRAALQRRLVRLQEHYPGVALADHGSQLRLLIPDRFRVGHEAHFGQVTNLFLGYLRHPGSLPGWERPNMLAKYRVTTEGVERARAAAASGGRPDPV